MGMSSNINKKKIVKHVTCIKHHPSIRYCAKHEMHLAVIYVFVMQKHLLRIMFVPRVLAHEAECVP